MSQSLLAFDPDISTFEKHPKFRPLEYATEAGVLNANTISGFLQN